MKSNRKLWMLALIFGLAAAVFFYRYLGELQKKYEPRDLQPVLVAVRDLESNTVLGREDLKVEKVPARYVQPRALHDADKAVGMVVMAAIAGGEQVTETRLLDKDQGTSRMAYQVPEGRRAVAVEVDDVSGVSGFVKPGDRVDILATLDVPVPGGEQTATYCVQILQDIMVLACGQTRINGIPDKAGKNNDSGNVTRKTMTLAVLPREAQYVTMAAERGHIRMALRSPVEKKLETLPPLELKQTLIPPPPVLPAQ